MNIKEINLELIDENPWNPNEMSEQQEAHLSEEYKRVGYLQPVLVRPLKGRFQVIDGAHRIRQWKKSGSKTIFAVVKEMTDKEAKLTTVNLNQIKGNLNPLKMAELLSDLGGYMSNEEISNILKISESELDAYKMMLALPEEVNIPKEEPLDTNFKYELFLTEAQNQTFQEAIKRTKIENISLAVMDIIEEYMSKNG